MPNRQPRVVKNLDAIRMPHALRNHQPVNAVGGQIFHVAIEQARAFPVEHSIAVANDRSNRGTRACQRVFADSHWKWTQLRMLFGVQSTRLELVGYRELRYGDFVLIRVTRPGAIHQRVGFILLVFCEGFQRARV